MAIGIDKYKHKRLIERLARLRNEDPLCWEAQELELTEAYEEVMKQVNRLELSAIRYKEVNEKIRPEVMLAFRQMRKKS